MITESELQGIMEKQVDVSEKPQGLLLTLFIYIVSGLVVRYIYDHCFKDGTMTIQRSWNPGFFDRIRLRRIVKNICKNTTIETSGVKGKIFGDVEQEADYNELKELIESGRLYDRIGAMVEQSVYRAGKCLVPSDFL